MKKDNLEKIYELRKPLYEKYADISVKISGESPEEAVQEIIRSIRSVRACSSAG